MKLQKYTPLTTTAVVGKIDPLEFLDIACNPRTTVFDDSVVNSGTVYTVLSKYGGFGKISKTIFEFLIKVLLYNSIEQIYFVHLFKLQKAQAKEMMHYRTNAVISCENQALELMMMTGIYNLNKYT